ncbi:MAG TPA: hypothetical protein VGF65_11260 [Mycobacterium sp.]
MKTLLLDPVTWDLCLDANGNLAVASDPYSVAQDVASACRLFIGELWFNTTKGIRYFEDILGKRPPLSLIKAALNNAALTVPTVATAQSFIQANNDREVTGQVQVTTTTGGTVLVTFPLVGQGRFIIGVSGIGQGAV